MLWLAIVHLAQWAAGGSLSASFRFGGMPRDKLGELLIALTRTWHALLQVMLCVFCKLGFEAGATWR